MHRVLYLLSAVALAASAYILLAASPTITQQTAGLVVLLIAAVLLTGGAVVQAVLSLVPREPVLTPEELHEKQVRELAESWKAPIPPPAA